MTDTTADALDPPAKTGKGPLIAALVLAMAGAGGGYYAVQAGLLPFGGAEPEQTETKAPSPAKDIEFVPIPPMVVSFTDRGRQMHLRFGAELEVGKSAKGDVELLLPRVVDVLNGYLRALEVADLQDPLALTRLRAQMLRRIQIVTGRDMVRDLLIMEFVLN